MKALERQDREPRSSTTDPSDDPRPLPARTSVTQRQTGAC